MDDTLQNPITCPSCQADSPAGSSSCRHCGTSFALTPTSLVVSIDLRPGALFHGRYEIIGPLGRGGMGMVWQARDRTLDEIVAIKILRPDFAADPAMATRFKSEIKLARRVRHRNVCAIHDFGEDQGLLYISMELIEGVDLKKVLREKGALPHAEAYDVAIQVAEGLQAVHDAGIVHRDLKTPNIMRDARGVTRLMDFGVAKRLGGEGTATATGHIIGTPEYMSPEQAQGRRVDARSDIYALGIVIYEIFTGHVPFRGETPISTILMHIHEPPPLDGPAADALPAALKGVLRRCLAKDADDRYPSARDAAEALRNAQSPSRRQQPVDTTVLEAPTIAQPAPRVAPPRPSAPPPPPRPRMSMWLLALPAVAVAGGIALLARQPASVAPAAAAPSPLVAAASLRPPELRSSTLPPAVAGAAPALPAPALVPVPVATPTPALAAPTRPSPRPTPPSARPAPSPSPVAITPPRVAVAPTPAPTVAPDPPRAPGAPGAVLVVVKPWAEVFVDGRTVGTTPLDRIALPAGAHTVRVRHPLYEPIERTVTVREGQTERLEFDLAKVGTRKQ